jgi:hypothetical protein
MKEKKDSLVEGAKKQDRQLLVFFNVNRFPFISTPLFPPYDQLFVFMIWLSKTARLSGCMNLLRRYGLLQ